MSALQASIERIDETTRTIRRQGDHDRPKSASLKVADHRERQGLDAMTKADLLERAKRLKIDVSAKMTKAELVAR